MIKLLKAKVTQDEDKRLLFGIFPIWSDLKTKKEVISIDDTNAKRFWREMSDMNKHLKELYEQEKENHTEESKKIARLSFPGAL